MKHTKILALGAIMLGSTALSLHAEDKVVHFIMCGGEIRAADQKTADAFEADHPGVKVNIEAVPWGTCQDKSLNLAAAGDPPALAYMGSRTLKQLSDNDLILPVEISEEQQAVYQPGVLATVSRGGKFWGYPHAFSTKGLYMNCDIVEAAGQKCEAPETWDDLYNLAKAVKDNTDAAGIGLVAKDFDNTQHQFLNYLYSNGGKVLDPETGDVLLNSPETVETLNFYGKLAEVSQEGPTAWERDQLKELFNDGQIAMYVSGPWGRGQHKETINQKVFPVPHGPHGKSGTILITDSLAVFKGSGVEDLAMDLAQRLSSGESQYDLDSSWGLTPIMQYEKIGIEKPYYKDDPFWKVFVDGIANGGPEPLVTDFKSTQTVFTNMVQGIILKEDTAENLVATAAEELEAIK